MGDLVDSCYIAVDHVVESFRSSSLERRVFAICLSSYLLEKHRTPYTLKTAKLAMNVLYTTIIYSKGLVEADACEVVLLLSEPILIASLRRICENCGGLVTEGTLLLAHIDKMLTESLSIESVHHDSAVEVVTGTNNSRRKMGSICLGSFHSRIVARVNSIRKIIDETRRSLAITQSV